MPTETAPGTTRPERDDPVLERGTVLGRYEIREVLGIGGGGAVYEAFDATLDRNIALKVLHTRGDPTKSVTLREARALAQFSHPNVVAVYDVGAAGGKGFIAMELARGERLDQWLRQSGLAWHQRLKVFLEAGKGLAAVHRARLVHRDFKPGNVVVREDGRVQLIDFGIARPEAEAEGAPSHQALVSGTPGFMAPEHMRGDQPGAQSDQFSFCSALYEALLGVLPFGDSADSAQLLRVEKQQFAAPASDAQVPRKVVEVLKRGLAFDPRARFESMDELVRALSRTLPLDRIGWTGVATLSLAAGATIGFMWLWSTTRAGGCSAEVRAVQEVWNDETRAALKRKMPSRALERLDGYASGLLDASREVCAAAQAEATPAARFEARSCLVRARRDFKSLLSSLQGAERVDGRQVEASVDAMLPASQCVSLNPAEVEDAVCGQQLFDAVSAWGRGHWSAALTTAESAEACATRQKALELAAAAQRLRGAVLERLGHREGARAAYRAAVMSALPQGGEQLALAWLSLARLEEPERAKELLEWTFALLEHAPSAPETRARAALMRARLAPSVEGKAAVLGAVAAAEGDPAQRALALAVAAQADAAQLGPALDAASALSEPAVPLLLELAEALALHGAQSPESGERLLSAAGQALAESDPETALARAHFGAVARRLGATAPALAVHQKLAGALPSSAPPLTRALVQHEVALSLKAAGQDAAAPLAQARAAAGEAGDLGRWLQARIDAER